jgi:hypothetical protein
MLQMTLQDLKGRPYDLRMLGWDVELLWCRALRACIKLRVYDLDEANDGDHVAAGAAADQVLSQLDVHRAGHATLVLRGRRCDVLRTTASFAVLAAPAAAGHTTAFSTSNGGCSGEQNPKSARANDWMVRWPKAAEHSLLVCCGRPGLVRKPVVPGNSAIIGAFTSLSIPTCNRIL